MHKPMKEEIETRLCKSTALPTADLTTAPYSSVSYLPFPQSQDPVVTIPPFQPFQLAM